jgi:hypothetical protein
MNRRAFRICTTAAGLALATALAAPAKDVVLETKTVGKKSDSLVWSVNRSVHGVRVEVLAGNPILNTVKFLGGEEFRIGAYFAKGQNWEHRLDRPVNVGQLRVTVDKAQGSQIRVTIFPSDGGEGAPAQDSSSPVKRPVHKQDSLIWDVNREIRGFEVVVREGRPILNTVKFLGGEEFHIGAYKEVGEGFRKDFDDRVRVGQLRVTVDQAQNSAIELKTW